MKRRALLVVPELKGLDSPDLDFGDLPDDPDNRAVSIAATIGPKGGVAGDLFYFMAATPSVLRGPDRRCREGRGCVVVERFWWQAVEREVLAIVSECSAPSWSSVADLLNERLCWEYHEYKG